MIMNAKYDDNFLNCIHKIFKDVIPGSCLFCVCGAGLPGDLAISLLSYNDLGQKGC